MIEKGGRGERGRGGERERERGLEITGREGTFQEQYGQLAGNECGK